MNRSHYFTLLLLIFFTLIPFQIIAQSTELPSWHVSTGVGTYSLNSNSDFQSGFEFSTEIGYRMHTGFNVGIGYSMAHVRIRFNEEIPFEKDVPSSIFNGLDGQEIHHAVRLVIGYHIPIGDRNRHVIGLGTGVMLVGEQRVFYDIFPTAVAQAPDGELFFQYGIQQSNHDQLFHIVGIPFNAEYIFRFTDRLALGLRAEGRYLFDYNFDRYSIAPKLVTFF